MFDTPGAFYSLKHSVMSNMSKSPRPIQFNLDPQETKLFLALARMASEHNLNAIQLDAIDEWLGSSHFPSMYNLVKKLSELEQAKEILKDKKYAMSLITLLDVLQVLEEMDRYNTVEMVFDDPHGRYAD
ncbi:MAG: hypothetical protein LPK80_10455 [Bacteroidota bacterium]|nr:hypothetical protein [Bacteroidota bacterium]